MGYTVRESMVRVDQFKASGKWYTTFELDMYDWYDTETLMEGFVKSFEKKTNIELSVIDHGEGFVVCLEPYHKNSHPIMMYVK